jgi:recombining binding protein (suppressor of hairless)
LQAAAARAAANSAAGETTPGNVATLNEIASAPTLQSILAAVSAQAAQTQAAAGGATDTPPWQTEGIPGSSGAASTSAITLVSAKFDTSSYTNHCHQSSLGKHPREDSEEDDSHPRTKRIGLQGSGLRRGLPMTTVICLHAAVAQKSYSTEKRFLCPPPVVHVEGSILRMRTQHLSMSVVSETGERSFDQKVALDKTNAASFKFLHVAGTGKAKSFQLTLDISEPGPSATNLDEQSPSGRTWASFDSAPVTIISKPSKKTAKTRNISSCILAGGPVSLFNRINSQTVRTKYMTIENSQLCASNTTWSAFTVNVARRSADTVPAGKSIPRL